MDGGKNGETGGRVGAGGGVGGRGGQIRKDVCLLFAYRPFFVCYLLIDFFFSFFFPPFSFWGKMGYFASVCILVYLVFLCCPDFFDFVHFVLSLLGCMGLISLFCRSFVLSFIICTENAHLITKNVVMVLCYLRR